jgi:radical SAM protein with 4Fe4S-binding SPASM domain
VWEITTACNLRCIHCEISAAHPRAGEMTTGEMISTADALAQAGCTNVSLTGGEPLLRGDWPHIANHLSGRGIQVKIVTNATLLDDRILSTMIGCGVHGVAVSLDGPREIHDGIRVPASRMGSRYDSAVSALERLAASPMRTAAITQINLRNIRHLRVIHDTLVRIGADTWQLQLAYPLGRLLEIKEPYLVDPSMLGDLERTIGELISLGELTIVTSDNIGYYGPHEPLLRTASHGVRSFWTGCMAGCLGVCIQSNGDVKGCPTHPDQFIVGNLRRESFEQIWADRSRYAYNTEWREELLEGECAGCPFGRVCRAGCTSMAFAVTGTIYDNPYCLQRNR